MDSVLSSEIRSKPHLQAFDDMAALRFDAIGLEKILVYMIDTVEASALPFLADQFNVLGLKGWNIAKTDADKRALIKSAVELRRYVGTPYGIRRALQSVGYAGADFEEGVTALYDGEFNFDGLITYGSGTWANFRVIADLGESKGINSIDSPQLVDLINAYKNVRSLLVDIFYKVSVSDTIPQDEEENLTIGMTTSDNVGAFSEEEGLTIAQDQINDSFLSLTEGNLTLNLLNSSGDLITQYIF